MSRRILVVDDEQQIRLLLRAAIATPDVDVLVAADGEEALLLARENSPLELVVTDIMMPGIDGFELASRLLSEGCASRFLFISGYFDGQEAERVLDRYGSAAFLAKPFSVPDLMRSVKGILAEEARLEKGISFRSRTDTASLRSIPDPVTWLQAHRHRSERLLEYQSSLRARTRAALIHHGWLAEQVRRNMSDLKAVRRPKKDAPTTAGAGGRFEDLRDLPSTREPASSSRARSVR
jgi:CheY-like chemotaxis protein